MAYAPTMATWRICSSCKQPIGFDATYYLCNVSTCRRERTGLFFCSVPCFEAHLPGMRHRDAWAEEERSPTEAAWQNQSAAPKKARQDDKPAPAAPAGDAPMDDVLIVVSKLKKYVKARSGLSTSDGVTAALSDHLRKLCDRAIREAARNDRKTVLDRDFRRVLDDD